MYCDADWASCPISRRSLIVYLIFLGNSSISWKTRSNPQFLTFPQKPNTVLLSLCIVNLSGYASFSMIFRFLIFYQSDYIATAGVLCISLLTQFIMSGQTHWSGLLFYSRWIFGSASFTHLCAVSFPTRWHLHKITCLCPFHYLLRKLGIRNLHTSIWEACVQDIRIDYYWFYCDLYYLLSLNANGSVLNSIRLVQ